MKRVFLTAIIFAGIFFSNNLFCFFSGQGSKPVEKLTLKEFEKKYAKDIRGKKIKDMQKLQKLVDELISIDIEPGTVNLIIKNDLIRVLGEQIKLIEDEQKTKKEGISVGTKKIEGQVVTRVIEKKSPSVGKGPNGKKAPELLKSKIGDIKTIEKVEKNLPWLISEEDWERARVVAEKFPEIVKDNNLRELLKKPLLEVLKEFRSAFIKAKNFMIEDLERKAKETKQYKRILEYQGFIDKIDQKLKK